MFDNAENYRDDWVDDLGYPCPFRMCSSGHRNHELKHFGAEKMDQLDPNKRSGKLKWLRCIEKCGGRRLVHKLGRVHNNGKKEMLEHKPKFVFACENCFKKEQFKDDEGKTYWDFVCQCIICDECIGSLNKEKSLKKAAAK